MKQVKIDVNAYALWLAESHNSTIGVFLPTKRQRNRFEFLHSYAVSGKPSPGHVWMGRIRTTTKPYYETDIPLNVLKEISGG